MPADRPHRQDLPSRGFGFLVPAIVWAVCFAAIYAVQGAGCAAGLHRVGLAGTDLLRLVLALLLLAALAAIAWVGQRALRTRRCDPAADGTAAGEGRFLAVLTLLSAPLFLVATIWVGFPVLLFDPCAGPLTGP